MIVINLKTLFYLSIARACYADADVYLFDDPLAAVDAHVASHLLANVFGHHGLLAGRTRIIATHHPNAIAAADRVAVLDAGRLVEYGTYASLTGRPTSHLNAFLRSEELRKRLLSQMSEAESEAMSVTVSMASDSLQKGKRSRTTTETRQNPDVLSGDIVQCEFL